MDLADELLRAPVGVMIEGPQLSGRMNRTFGVSAGTDDVRVLRTLLGR